VKTARKQNVNRMLLVLLPLAITNVIDVPNQQKLVKKMKLAETSKISAHRLKPTWLSYN